MAGSKSCCNGVSESNLSMETLKLTKKRAIFCTWLIAAIAAIAISFRVDAAEKHLYRRSVGEIFEDKQAQELARAAAAGNIKKIEVLVNQKGVPVDAHGYLGVTPLWWAAQKMNLKGFQKLLELGADPNYQWSTGDSVMNHVVRMKEPEYLRLCIEHGGNVNLERHFNGVSDTPITQGIFDNFKNDNVVTLLLLIEAGADVNHDKGGVTPVMSAAQLRLWEPLLAMLEKGGDYMKKAPSGEVLTLVMVQYSLENEHPKGERAKSRQAVVDFLIGKGVDLKQYSKKK